jgi:hypothetical protein
VVSSPLLSLDARPAFTRTVLRLLPAPFLIGAPIRDPQHLPLLLVERRPVGGRTAGS